MGNRIAKLIYTDNTFTLLEKSTYYVRDASGNVMAVYDRIIDASIETGEFMLSERHIYGSSRIGMDVSTHVFGPDPYTALTETTRELGHKQYEISNHLGNVLSVITDQKLPVEVGSLIVSYSAVVVTATDYSPFGVGLYGRSWSGEYRYGFNGQEVDSEGMGGGSSTYDYGFRIYNAQLGKFLSVDPLLKKYPELTVYQYASNTPIWAIDVDGLEAEPTSGEQPLQINPGDEEKIQKSLTYTEQSKLDCSLTDLTIYETQEYTLNSDVGYSFSGPSSNHKQVETGWKQNEASTFIMQAAIIAAEGRVGTGIAKIFSLPEKEGFYLGVVLGIASNETTGDLIIQDQIEHTCGERIQWYGKFQIDLLDGGLVASDCYGYQITQVVVSAVYVERLINKETGQVIYTSDGVEVPMLPSDPADAPLTDPIPLNDYGTINMDR